MTTRLTLRCNACRCLISQDEADRANEVYPCENTYCTNCAAAFAEGGTDDPTAGEPE